MILVVGEVLFDIFPDYKRLGGAPFNFARHLHAFGMDVGFAGRVGDDQNGEKIKQAMRSFGMRMDLLQTDQSLETGYVRVELNDEGVPEFDIVSDVAYDRLEYTPQIESVLHSGPELIYCGTLIQRSPRAADSLASIFQNKPPESKCFCDINLRSGCYDAGSVKRSLKYADVLKLNLEELDIVGSMTGLDSRREVLELLREEYAVEWISLTMGRDGGRLITPEGDYFAAPDDSIDIRDTVGAGDAYAAILAVGYLKGWNPERIVKRAAKFAGAVCGIEGATPENMEFYDQYETWMEEDGR